VGLLRPLKRSSRRGSRACNFLLFALSGTGSFSNTLLSLLLLLLALFSLHQRLVQLLELPLASF